MNSILPTLHRQKKFIIENAHILNKEIKISILSIVMMEIGKDVISSGMGTKGVNINLDAIEEINAEIITHIYNIIKMRLTTLSKPVKG
jgi:hypothetical protein|uniref:Uncharacterized protein n=1 Tax=viral metagenome TaxID=1070528 RepID=A0A6C0I018_9ZZZZ